ncbi:hypothetical protein [Mucilaginibacter sp. PPCGB 2223]|uniref:hypothetical protein n=1 Tax=Mucilaginibacter sp. PPCGB 2223 TaxID=1886027 RepID=UPI001586D1FD|nr:hypothetical protein [Mucilaginibacter sp. PPCGB 2223]
MNCGAPVGAGRKDRQYCSDLCKTEYNNNKQAAKRRKEKNTQEVSVPDFVSGINAILLNNRRILDECLGEGEKCTLKKRDVDGRGFRFKFFTSCDSTTTGVEYYFCYDLGYKIVEEERLVIVRRPREATY